MKAKKNTYWLMSSANKELNAIRQKSSRAKVYKKINYFPSIESYCVKKGWCYRQYNPENYSVTYALTPEFTPTDSHVREIVNSLSKR